MEFEEMKKIWDAQNNQPLYVINEQALHKHILGKKKKMSHIATVSEWMLISINAVVGIYILVINFTNGRHLIFAYLLATLLLANAVYSLVSRIRRLNSSYRFDHSMLGDLQHALATATYQVRLSRNMRLSFLFTFVFTITGIWEGKKTILLAVGAIVFFVLVWYASKWEHNIYKAKKRELEAMLKKLQQEETNTGQASL